MQEEGFIYEWNSPDIPVSRPVAFCDGTLYDGLQSLSVRTPPIEKKLCILRLLKSLEIGSADIGLPDPGAHVASEVGRLATKITWQRMEPRSNPEAQRSCHPFCRGFEASGRVHHRFFAQGNGTRNRKKGL